MGDRPAALDKLHSWHRNILDSMIIDIILIHPTDDDDDHGNVRSAETVIERWVVQYENPLIISSLASSRYEMVYKVSSFSDVFSPPVTETMKEFRFSPVEVPPGRLCASVTYRSDLSDFNLGAHITLPPRIITDYVGTQLLNVPIAGPVAFTDLLPQTNLSPLISTGPVLMVVTVTTSFLLPFRHQVLLLLQEGVTVQGLMTANTIQAGSLDCSLQVAHQDSAFLGARVDYLRIWRTLIVHALLISMMLTSLYSSTAKVLTGGKLQALYHSRYL
uniref:Uncharacterized protein n=1 Tax=Brassica oleracea TaxID=3712 RepID=A0A3P6B4H8_BRAOL|nr:unnamed protein product [Brassica oleracea]